MFRRFKKKAFEGDSIHNNNNTTQHENVLVLYTPDTIGYFTASYVREEEKKKGHTTQHEEEFTHVQIHKQRGV